VPPIYLKYVYSRLKYFLCPIKGLIKNLSTSPLRHATFKMLTAWNKKQCSELQVSLCLLSVGAPLSENPSKHVLPKSLEIRIIRAFPYIRVFTARELKDKK